MMLQVMSFFWGGRDTMDLDVKLVVDCCVSALEPVPAILL